MVKPPQVTPFDGDEKQLNITELLTGPSTPRVHLVKFLSA